MSEAAIKQADNDIPSPGGIFGPEGEVVFKCEEFTLYANGWLEPSTKVERALWRATLGISNRKGSEDRLELALALLKLAEHEAEQQRSAGAEVSEAAMKRDADLLKRLSDTVGKMLIPMLSTPQLKSAEKKAEEAAARLKNAIASLKSATLAIARWKTSRPKPGSNHPGAIVWEMQLVAKEMFRETHKRPTKRQIRAQLEEKLFEAEILAELEVVREQLNNIGRGKRLTEDQICTVFAPVRKRMRDNSKTEACIREHEDEFRKRLREAEDRVEREERPLSEDEIDRRVSRARQEMEKKGWAISSKDAEARWAERFINAGLEGLPD